MRSHARVSLLLVLAGCSPAVAQSSPTAASPPQPNPQPQSEAAKPPTPATLEEPKLSFQLLTGGLHRFKSEIDDGGKVGVSSFGMQLTGRYRFSDDFTLSASLGYSYSQYDFTGTTGFGGLAPWDQVHTGRFSVTGMWRVDDHWSIFGGPTAAFSGEDDADFGDGFTAGGVIGATYAWDAKTYLGVGVIVTSAIEDSMAVYPLIRFNLPLTDSLTLRNPSVAIGSAGSAGAELAWTINDHWSMGLSAQYLLERFRLDDTGPQPGGVGEDSTVPIILRGTWTPRKDVSITAFVGAAVGGSVRLDDSSGNEIASQDVDAAAVLGIALDLKF